MPAPKPLKTASDAFVTEQRPKLHQPNANRLWVAAVSGNIRRAFLFFTLGYPKGSNVLKGKFRMWNSKAVSGTVSVTVTRVTEKWNVGRLNWSNQPDVTNTNSVTVTKNSPAANTMWEWDVEAILDTVSNTDKWWGFRVHVSSSSGVVVFYSANANSKYRPELEVEWTEAPEAPDDVHPAGGRAVGTNQPTLEFNFQDDAGDTELNACRVMFKNSNTGWNKNSGFTSPTWDSGVKNVSEPELNLEVTAGAPTLASDVLTWWTVAVQDGAGFWSEYSEPVSFKYLAPAVVTLNNPASDPNNFVTDTTPPIDWSVSGGATQTAFKILVSDPDDPEEIPWSSGKITSTDTDFTLPRGVIKRAQKDYQLDLLVWDDAPREKNSGRPIYTRVTRMFTFEADATVAKITTLIASQAAPWPWVDLTFSRATMPDEFTILRDGEVIEANIQASDLFTSGTSYTYRDKKAAPRVPHIWEVRAVVDGKTSDKKESNTLTTKLLAPMMMETDATNPIILMNPSVTPQLTGFQEAHQPLRGQKVLVTQYQGGFDGHVDGVLADDVIAGLTAREMKKRFKKWRRSPGESYWFYNIDEAMEIVPFNMTYYPKAYSGGVKYIVSFDFFEVD